MKTYAIILHMIQFFRSKQNKIKLMMKHLKTYIHKTLKVIVVNLLLLFFLFLFIESIFCFYAVTKGPCFHNFLNNTNSGKIETKELPFITIVKNMKRVAHYKYFEQDFKIIFVMMDSESLLLGHITRVKILFWLVVPTLGAII